ncbi:ubiquinol-cytochrome-c reductase complex assembly factor 1 [Ornithorhynchus anatinus]|uniref:ubiquinol-cytochrome-c reductase complex assembly factor 1 n=1 Tax=Ornithorhynchus anatinus TaxID=9258 RepID=UPI0010A8BE74|nr:ubiquinol-cytochrome-c reductase complex assembly factor 1 [Ornithorhynchus anatinus]
MAALAAVLRSRPSAPLRVAACGGHPALRTPLLPAGPWSRPLWLPPQRAGPGHPPPSLGASPRKAYRGTGQLLTAKDSVRPSEEKVGPLTKIIEAMGFTGPLKYSRWKIKIAALRMYTSCVERTDFEEFFLRCQMPDTFNSWFLITLLHFWMCLVRMKQEGRAGKYMCRTVVHFMWEDVERRGRVMGAARRARSGAPPACPGPDPAPGVPVWGGRVPPLAVSRPPAS